MARPMTVALALMAACGQDATLGLTSPSPPDAGAATDAAAPPGPEPIGEPRPGARLVPAFVEGPGGAVSRFLHFVDAAAAHEPCYLPLDATSASPMTCRPKADGELRFATATCDEPVVVTRAVGYTIVRIAPVPLGGGGDYPVRVGALLSPQPAQLYAGQGVGRCATNAYPPHAAVYASDRDAAPAPASGRLVEDRGEPRVRLQFFEGDDGSRVLYAIIDDLTQARCAPEQTSAGLRCAPESLRTVDDHGLLDERCERLVVLDRGPISVASVPQRNDDTYRFAPYPMGTDGTVVVGRRRPTGACQVSRLDLEGQLPFVGVPYPSTEWPAMTARRTGDDDLSAEVVEVGGVRAEGERRFWANERAISFETHGLACTPVWTDGRLRCLPVPPSSFRSYSQVYADRACTEPLLAFDGSTSPPTEVAVTQTAMLAMRHLLPEGELVAVGSAFVGDAFERTGPEQPCRPLVVERPPAALFRRGPRVDDSHFPELRVVVGRP